MCFSAPASFIAGAGLAAAKTESFALSSTIDPLTALNHGYHVAFLVGAGFAALAAALSAFLLRETSVPEHV